MKIEIIVSRQNRKTLYVPSSICLNYELGIKWNCKSRRAIGVNARSKVVCGRAVTVVVLLEGQAAP